MAKIRLFRDNAMLFKDITQWLRRRTFMVLFMGLLGSAQIVSFVIIALQLAPGQAGPATFTILSIILFIYLLLLSFMTHGHVSKEFTNRTFELFELSGMSIERMVRGKLFSAFAEFLFGFFAIVPYMFFSYLQGGLDFYQIFAMILLLFLLAPPLCILPLAVGLMGKKNRAVTLAKAGGILVILYLVFMAFVLIMAQLRGAGNPLSEIVMLVKLLIELDSDALVGFSIFMALYIQIFMLFFYFCCNSICPPSDSRQSHVKMAAFTLLISWLGLMGYEWVSTSGSRSSREILYTICIVAMIWICLLGLICFYGRRDAPVMARMRLARSARWRRTIMAPFAPGAYGAFLTLRLVYLSLIGFGAFLLVIKGGDVQKDSFFAAFSMPLQMPFFLGFPAVFLIMIPSLRRKPGSLAAMVLLWWVCAGAILFTLEAFYTRGFRAHDSVWVNVIEPLSLFASPFSSCSIGYNNSPIAAAAPWIRFILGVVGVPLMLMTLKKMPTKGVIGAAANPDKPNLAAKKNPPPLPPPKDPEEDKAPREEEEEEEEATV